MKRFVFGYLLFTTILAIVLLYPYSTFPASSLPNSVDPVFYAWNLMHNYTSALHGFKNLLDTNIFYPEGNTLALSDTLFAQTVFVSPILALTHNPVLAENIYVLATFPLAAITMFFLCLYLTESPLAAGIAGIMFAFATPRLAQIGHMPAISSQWLPLIFLSLIRWIREQKVRHLILLFFWFTLSITSTMYFGVFVIPLALIIGIFEVKKAQIGLLARQLARILIPAIIIVVILLFPYIRLRAEYPGIRRSLEDAVRLSATPIDYISVLPTSWLSDIGFPINTNERALYPTIILLGLALLSFRKKSLPFLLLGAIAGLLALGPYMGTIKLPYYYLYKAYPLLESIRVPARFSIFMILGFAVSASFTMAKIEKRNAPLLLLVLVIFLTEIWQVNTPFVYVPKQNQLPRVYSFIKQMPEESVIVELPLHPEWNSIRMEDQLNLTYDAVNENTIYATEAYRTYFSAFHNKRMLNGYSGYFPNIYHDHSIALDKFPTQEGIDMLKNAHVRYILIHSAQYLNEPYSDVERRIRDFTSLHLIQTFGADYVYEIQ